VLRAILDGDERGSGVTRNDFEEDFAGLVEEHGLPRPRFNADVAVAGRFFEVDCAWGEAKLVVELDGRAAHGTRKAFEEDRERDRLLLAEGWRVVRVTWRQLRDQRGAIAADLSRLLVAGA
jgi:very-short-patch-repair endonuclease